MAFDYVWGLKPNAAGLPDGLVEQAWVDLDRADAEVQPFFLSVAGEIPVSSRTVRIRWRPGISTRSVLVDGEGHSWRVADVQEVGRKRFIDLSVSTVDVQSGLDTPTTTAPVGWHLVDADGSPVVRIDESLITPEYLGDRSANLGTTGKGFRIWLLSDWAFVETWAYDARIGAEIGGVDCWLTFRKNNSDAVMGDQVGLNDIAAAITSSEADYFFNNQSLVARRTRQRVWPFGPDGDLWLFAVRRDTGDRIWADTVVHGFSVVNF